jgi:diguanylate cyclase (GGDEF)-like protein
MNAGHPRKVIIVVEDDADSRLILERLLTRAGYQVQSFVNGLAAKEPIIELRTGVVIADWNMPDMNGLQLLEFVRGMEQMGALSTIYYILLTAQSEKSQLVHGLNSGADDYLVKPYHHDELLARIQAGVRIVGLQECLHDQQAQLAKSTLELEAARRKLEQMASIDSLTGLLNRRAFYERFSEFWSLSQRHGRPLSCLMLDVDHFKQVNDLHGHAAGDAVLKVLARTLQAHLRKQDICGRYGGEEFCVVCPETSLEGAEMVAERAREAIEAACTEIDGTVLRITASIGVATRADRDPRIEDAVARADAMLYQAKQEGRNQVWSIDPHGRTRRVTNALNSTSRPQATAAR